MMTGVHRRFWLILVAIVVVAFAIRWGYVVEYRRDQASCNLIPPKQICGDAYNYHVGANLLADGKGYIDALVLRTAFIERPSAMHPPAYVTYLGVWSVFGARTVLWHQFASVLVGLGSVVALALFGRDLLSPRLGLVAAGVLAVYPYVWVSDGAVMSETLALLAAICTAWAAARFLRRPTTRAASLLGVTAALSMLCRSEFVLYLPMIIVAALLGPLRRDRRRTTSLVAVSVASFALVAAPWVVRNLTTFNRPVTVTTGLGLAVAYSNCDTTYGGTSLGYWSYWCAQNIPVAVPGLDESDEEAALRRQAFDYIGDHTTKLPKVLGARVLRQWNLFTPGNQIALDTLIEGRERAVSRAGLAAYYLMAPFAVLGAIVSWRRHRALLAAVAIVPIIITAAAVVTYANTRFRVPAEFVMVLLATVGALHVWDRLRSPIVMTSSRQ